MLKETILAAVSTAKSAVQNLATPAKLVVRGAAVHVPGSAPTYAEDLFDIKFVSDKFTDKEIDGERIKSTDYKWIMFPESSVPTPSVNHLVRILVSLPDIQAGDYRVIKNDQVMAGDTVALSQLQIRKL